jgi:hypothetical protein
MRAIGLADTGYADHGSGHVRGRIYVLWDHCAFGMRAVLEYDGEARLLSFLS